MHVLRRRPEIGQGEIDTAARCSVHTTRELLTLIFETVHRQLVNSDLRVLVRIVIAEGERFPALTELYYAETVSKGGLSSSGSWRAALLAGKCGQARRPICLWC